LQKDYFMKMEKRKNNTNIALISFFGLDLGVRLISSSLKKLGHNAQLINFNQKKYPIELFDNDFFSNRLQLHEIAPQADIENLKELLKRLKPRIIGLSVSAVSMLSAKRISREIRKISDALIVWGGIHAVICPEECIEFADVVCVGEGELAMLELVQALVHGKEIDSIPGFWVKQNGKIKKNPMRPLINNLDDLEFPDFIGHDNKFLIDSGKIIEDPPIAAGYSLNTYPIMTSRGCMYKCSFCSETALSESYKGTGTYLRRRSVKSIIKELQQVTRERPIYKIRFFDDVFTYDKKWIEEFCDMYGRYIGIPFICYAHPKYTDRELLIKLRHAGLFYICVGIQSGSKSVIENVYDRNQSNSSIIEFSRFVKKLNILVRYDLILDNPYETDQDHYDSTELMLNLPYPYQVNLLFLRWFPKTPLTQRALEEGVISPDQLEQNCAGALDKWYLQLGLSKDKKDLFWNTIKAMAVNRRFSPKFVRWSMRMDFFQKHPKLLLFLARSYFRIFIRYKLKKNGRRFGLSKQIPRSTAKLKYYSSDILSKLLITSYSADWAIKPKIEYSVFLIEAKDQEMQFCLNIRNNDSQSQELLYGIDIISYDKIDEDPEFNPLWKIKASLVGGNDQKVFFYLKFPELEYESNESMHRLKAQRPQKMPNLAKGIYLLRLRHIGVKGMMPFPGKIIMEL